MSHSLEGTGKLAPSRENMIAEVRSMRISELKATLRANGVTDTATFREKRDLEDALIGKLSNDMINSVAAGLETGVSKEEQLETAQKPSDVPAHLRVPGVEAPTVLGMFAKLAPTHPGPTTATLDAFNEVLSGAPAPAEIRADWPFPADAADPVARLEMIESHLVFKFESPLAAHVWVWKINYQIFAGEGAMMLGTQNMPPEKCGFRITSTLFYLMRYISDSDLVYEDGAWRLTCENKVGRYEPGRGEKEPLLQWCLRTIDRLAGRLTYETPHGQTP